MRPDMRWELTSTDQNEQRRIWVDSVNDYRYRPTLGTLLAEGWEPFAVDTPNMTPRIWLKRQVDRVS